MFSIRAGRVPFLPWRAPSALATYITGSAICPQSNAPMLVARLLELGYIHILIRSGLSSEFTLLLRGRYLNEVMFDMNVL